MGKPRSAQSSRRRANRGARKGRGDEQTAERAEPAETSKPRSAQSPQRRANRGARKGRRDGQIAERAKPAEHAGKPRSAQRPQDRQTAERAMPTEMGKPRS